MERISSHITESLSSIPGMDIGELKKAQRVSQVRMMWKSLVEDVFLKHTNGVYIFTENGVKQMHVYMDESIYAAELNNRRELIKLQCREQFGEEIDEFHIHISRGKRKAEHPFIEETISRDNRPSIPLSSRECEDVEKTCENIPDLTLREHFKKAMTSDLEWKKGNL
jgi:hypothetical protein